MNEVELRCGRCHDRHPQRRPPLLATVRGVEILVPVRIGARRARDGGVGRAGMFWRAPAEDHGDVIFRCRRCGCLSRVLRHGLERAARSALLGQEARTLYLGGSVLTMAPASH